MKKHVLHILPMLIFLIMSKMMFAINPVELLSIAPPPSDSVQVTIDLGALNCAGMACETYTVYISGTGGNQILFSGTYSGWGTFTGPWVTVTVSGPKKICVAWHSDGLCSPNNLPDKICCVPYNGSGPYTI